MVWGYEGCYIKQEGFSVIELVILPENRYVDASYGRANLILVSGNQEILFTHE